MLIGVYGSPALRPLFWLKPVFRLWLLVLWLPDFVYQQLDKAKGDEGAPYNVEHELLVFLENEEADSGYKDAYNRID